MSSHWKSVRTIQAASAEDRSHFTVLVVDDHADSLFYAQQAIEIFGYSAMVLEEGERAVEMAKACDPAVILLDICLRDVNGFEVIAQLKQDRKTAHIPVVAATALVADSDKAQAIAAGFDGFLAKPYTLSDLESALEQYVPRQATDLSMQASAAFAERVRV